MKLNKIDYINLNEEVGRLLISLAKQALALRSLSTEINELADELPNLKLYVLDGIYSLYEFRYELLTRGVPVEKINSMDIVALPGVNKTIAGDCENVAKMNKHDKKVSRYNNDLDKLKSDVETFKRKIKALDKQTDALTPNVINDWSFTPKQVMTIKENISLAKELARHI